MNRYQILIEYVGTNYNGWQIQRKGKTIQGKIQKIISKILKEKILCKNAHVNFCNLPEPDHMLQNSIIILSKGRMWTRSILILQKETYPDLSSGCPTFRGLSSGCPGGVQDLSSAVQTGAGLVQCLSWKTILPERS